jgi:hypothetical protein
MLRTLHPPPRRPLKPQTEKQRVGPYIAPRSRSAALATGRLTRGETDDGTACARAVGHATHFQQTREEKRTNPLLENDRWLQPNHDHRRKKMNRKRRTRRDAFMINTQDGHGDEPTAPHGFIDMMAAQVAQSDKLITALIKSGEAKDAMMTAQAAQSDKLIAALLAAQGIPREYTPPAPATCTNAVDVTQTKTCKPPAEPTETDTDEDDCTSDSESDEETQVRATEHAFMINRGMRVLGTPTLEVSVDEAHPRVRNVLTLLPKEFRERGKQAIIDEIETLVDLEVFEWVNLPPGAKSIPCKMVEKVKFKGDGTFDKVKMRCVVKGYLQRVGIDFGAVYSPTAMISSIRIILVVAVTRGWDIFELDVKNAYCHGIMDKECYIELPPGITLSDPTYSGVGKRALKLLKGLYGTHQGGRLWFHRYKKELMDENGFIQCHFDPAVFWRKLNGLMTIVAIYVDDSIITGDDTKGIAEVRGRLIDKFGGTTGPLNSFLNLFMTYDKPAGRLEMHHAFYRRQIFENNNVSTEITASSPYRDPKTSTLEWSDDRHQTLLNNYRSIVASWIYDANTCCPFIAHPLSLLCSKMHEPGPEDALNLDQFMRYMAKHIDTPYVIQRPTKETSDIISISSFTDSSFADLSDPRGRATKGAIHFAQTSPVMWGSHKISRMSPSSNAAEQAAAAAASHDTVWMRSFCVELGVWDVRFRAPLFCDNSGVVGIANDITGLTHRNRWMRIDYFHFRDFQRAGDIIVRRIPTQVNPADFFTKNTGSGKLAKAIDLLTGNSDIADIDHRLRKCLYHDKTSTEPLPDTPISEEQRRLLRSAAEDPYIELDEVDRRADEIQIARNQAALNIRGEGHTADGQGYAD